MFRIVDHPLDLLEATRFVSGEEAGGIASFVGIVRKENHGKKVVAVEYQAYSSMAEKVMRRIGEEIGRDLGPLRIAMIHRTGRLMVGEASVIIVAGATHRREALSAVSRAIERLKREVPIWKKEFYEDGSDWLEPAPGEGGPPANKTGG